MKDVRLCEESLRYPAAYYIPLGIMALAATFVAINPWMVYGVDQIAVFIIAISLMLPLAIMVAMKLRFHFTEDSFVYNFTGSGTKEIFREDIAHAEVVEYEFTSSLSSLNPLRDRNYIMGGQYALKVTTKSGKTVTMTTRNARKLRSFLEHWLTTDVAVPEPHETFDLDARRPEPLGRTGSGYSASDLV